MSLLTVSTTRAERTLKITIMNATDSTRRSFNAAVKTVLESNRSEWPQPVIYAEERAGEMIFAACNAPALGGEEIVWMYVESDSFGDLSGDAQSDADGIEANNYEQAVSDIEDEIGSRIAEGLDDSDD